MGKTPQTDRKTEHTHTHSRARKNSTAFGSLKQLAGVNRAIVCSSSAVPRSISDQDTSPFVVKEITVLAWQLQITEVIFLQQVINASTSSIPDTELQSASQGHKEIPADGAVSIETA